MNAPNPGAPVKTFFGFTKLVVTDLDAMSRFYREVFGMHEVQRVSLDDFDEVMLSLSQGDPHPMIILLQYRDMRPLHVGNAHGPNGFVTTEMEVILQRLRTRGGSADAPVPIPGVPARAAFATDPEGHEIEIIEFLEVQQVVAQ